MDPWSQCMSLVAQMIRWKELEDVQERGRSASTFILRCRRRALTGGCLRRQTGCLEICELIEGNPTRRQLLNQASSLDAVARAMSAFPCSLPVQAAGSQAILYLCAGGGLETIDPSTNDKAVFSAVSMVLVQCLRRFTQEKVRGAQAGLGTVYTHTPNELSADHGIHSGDACKHVTDLSLT